jgi:hypothetical protein
MRNAAAVFVFLRQVGDEHVVHRRRVVAGIDVQVDVDVVFPRQLEHAVDVSRMIGVVVGRAADRGRAHLNCLDQRLVGLRHVGETLLGEGADFEIDRPGVFLLQHLQRFDALGADRQIDLGVGADARGALLDAVLQRDLGAIVDVSTLKARLHRLYAPHVVGIAAARLGRAAIDDAGLVEVDVRLDKPAAAKAALRVVGRRVCNKLRSIAAIFPFEKPISTAPPLAAPGTRALRIT